MPQSPEEEREARQEAAYDFFLMAFGVWLLVMSVTSYFLLLSPRGF